MKRLILALIAAAAVSLTADTANADHRHSGHRHSGGRSGVVVRSYGGFVPAPVYIQPRVVRVYDPWCDDGYYGHHHYQSRYVPGHAGSFYYNGRNFGLGFGW